MSLENDLNSELIEYEYGGFLARFFAMVIDYIILFIIDGATLFPFYGVFVAPHSYELFVVNNIALLLIPLIYSVVFWVWLGATPGKLICNLKVVDSVSGKNMGILQSVFRYFGYFISGFFLMLGYIWALFDSKTQTWHDKMASSVVIKERAKKVVFKASH